MKNVFVIALAMVMSIATSFAQTSKYETFEATSAPFEFLYDSKADVLISKTTLSLQKDGMKLDIYPHLKKKGSKFVYAALVANSDVGTCFENDELFMVLGDTTNEGTFRMKSFQNFNCVGNSYFDFDSRYGSKLNEKCMLGLVFTNGRSGKEFVYAFVKEDEERKEQSKYFLNFFKALDEFNSQYASK